jgi:hypothetical protein
MDEMRSAFQRYLNENPEADDILNTYDEIEAVYRELQQAMGWTAQIQPIAADSAKVTISLEKRLELPSGEVKEKALSSAKS